MIFVCLSRHNCSLVHSLVEYGDFILYRVWTSQSDVTWLLLSWYEGVNSLLSLCELDQSVVEGSRLPISLTVSYLHLRVMMISLQPVFVIHHHVDGKGHVSVRLLRALEAGLRKGDHTLPVYKNYQVCTGPLRKKRGDKEQGWTNFQIHKSNHLALFWLSWDNFFDRSTTWTV